MNDALLYVFTTNGILFLISILFFKFPPKKINSLYGYKTPKAMQNQQIWDFANTTFNRSFLIYAGISFLAGLVFAEFLKAELTWQPMAFVFLTIIVSIVKTEKALTENFTEEGKRKK
ncbi:SdpI family protein [uncultured Polaribacter sp.]|uniref:SdpI family protein n=1 Tax=uncultured Polaribacter sp. TaxID=174711 RepID=UPI002601F62F|nr:SdpI family protein [uncultured Polaribacter sp.]